MSAITQALGPAGALILLLGSIMLFVVTQIYQLKDDVRHLAIMRVKDRAELVELKVLPITALQESLGELEEQLRGSDAKFVAHLLKTTIN